MGRREATHWEVRARWGLLLGLALLAGGFIVQDVRAGTLIEPDRIAQAMMIAGLALAAIGVLANFRALGALVRGRRTLEGVNFAAVVLLFLALAGLLCYISTRWFARMDWTGKRTYSLHSKTTNTLRGLDRDVEAFLVYAPTMADAENRAIQMTGDMLDEFKAYSHRIKVREIDWSQPENQEELVRITQRLGERPPAPSVLFFAGDSHEVVQLGRAYSTASGKFEYLGEDALASALTKLTTDEKAAVYFLTGHGERPYEVTKPAPMPGRPPPPDGIEARNSLSRLANGLRRDNFEVSSLNLAEEGDVPEDCAVLVIAGPQTPFSERELKVLRNYLEKRRGSLILLVDPDVDAGAGRNVNDLIADYGLRLQTDAVGLANYERGFFVEQAPRVFIASDGLGKHPITADLGNYNISLPSACPLEIVKSDNVPAAPVPLLTAPRAWGERDYEPTARTPFDYTPDRDVAPPFLAAAVAGPHMPAGIPLPPGSSDGGWPGPKVLVVGSSLGFVNAMVEQNPGNLYFLQNAVNWMGGRLQSLGIPPKTVEFSRVVLTDVQQRAGRYVFIGILPACIVALGISVWLVRRKRR